MNKNILFVDDELSILKSIKRLFFKSGYNIFLAESAKEGLEIIEKNRIDIVVSDVKMPVMDGLTFLNEVKKLYPSIDRIVLSGFVEMDLVLRAIIKGIAFDYITKPWENEVLYEKLKNVILIREQIGHKEIIKKLNQLEVLPRQENIYSDFSQALTQEKPLEELSYLAKKDIAIGSKILQLVNSAFYAKNKIGSIEQAIEIIGIRGLKNIVNNSILCEKTNLNIEQEKELEDYNKKICHLNFIFKKIYETFKNESLPKNLENIGLIPYIGKIILMQEYYERYVEILDILKSNPNMSFWEAQLKSSYDDFTYIELGAYLLSLWNFPSIYFTIIFNFKTPYTAHDEIKELIAILNIALEYAEIAVISYENCESIQIENEKTIKRIEALINEYKQ
jgi:YesN/AraC family two-component response regulator